MRINLRWTVFVGMCLAGVAALGCSSDRHHHHRDRDYDRDYPRHRDHDHD